MKSKPFKGVAPPNLAGKGPDYEITRAQLVALVAKGVPRDDADDEKTVRNRVSSRVDYAVAVRKLLPTRRGGFNLGDVVWWARETWRGRFDQLPVFPRPSCDTASDKLHISDSMRNLILPRTPAQCHEAMWSMDTRIVALEGELAAQREQVRTLAVKANKLDSWNRNKGRRSRHQ